MIGTVHTAPAIAPDSGSALDTLAQLRNFTPEPPSDPPSGKGHARALVKRARAKTLAAPTAAALCMEVIGTGSPLLWAYGRSLECASIAEQDVDGKIRSHYCKNRWCPTCGRIRTGRLINQYGPVIDSWGEDARFVTLTARTVTGPNLSARGDDLVAMFNRCKDSMRKEGVKLQAIRGFDVTYNPQTNRYHMHIHAVVKGESAAYMLVAYWLKKWGGEAVREAQDVRPVTEGSANELFKYSTKLIGDKKPIPPKALDVIFNALRGRRMVQPVGFVAPKVDPVQDAEQLETIATTLAPSRVGERIVWRWVQAVSDWVDFDTGDMLSGYEPSDRYKALCDSIAAPDVVIDAEYRMHEARIQRNVERRRAVRLNSRLDTHARGE